MFKKEFKGFIITYAVWTFLLVPWFIRNFFTFSDIGRGLYLPFSTRISELILLIFPQGKGIICCDQLAVTSLIKFTSIADLISNSQVAFMLLINSEYLLVFALIFTGVTFFSLERLKSNFWYKTLIISLIIGIYYYIFNFLTGEIILQYVSIFILPPILLAIFYKKRKQSFSTTITRFQSFTILYLFIHFIAMYSVATLSGWSGISARFFEFQIFLLIPLSIFGLEQIIKHTFPKITKKREIISVLIISLFLSPMIVNMADGYDSLNKMQWWVFENEEITQVNNIIKEEISSNKIIASNYSSEVWFRTGIKSISLPHHMSDQATFENYLDYFDISHIVFYGADDPLLRMTYDQTDILDWYPINYIYESNFIGKNSVIINVIDVLNSDISNPTAYLAKSIKLEKSGKIEEATKIYNELRNYESNDKFIEEEICKSFTSYEFFDEAIYKCNMLLKKDFVNLAALHNLAIGYANTEQKDKMNEILVQYDKIIEESNNEQTLKSWGETVDYLIKFDFSYNEIKNNLLLKIKTSEEQGDLLRVLRIIEQIEYVDALSLDTHESKIRVLTKLEKYEDVLVTYDSAIEIYKNKIKKLNNEGFFEQANNMEKSLINLMKAKGVLLINLEDFHKANRVYLEILGIDKFDLDVHKKIAAYHEKYGKLRQALQNYEWALNLQPENDFLIEKIKELKDKIAD